jgi:iron complex transport system permease protein
VALFVTLLHIGIGSFLWLTPFEVLQELFKGNLGGLDTVNDIIWQIRLPRAVGCILGGALLGAAGSVFQTLFKNPLADPYVLGVSSGSAIGGALAIILGISGAFSGLGILFCSFLAGMLSLLFVLYIAQKQGILNTSTLLLGGVVMGTLQSALVTLILLLAGKDLNQVFKWLLGSTTPMFWNKISMMTLALTLGFFFLLKETKHLNAFSISESTAQRLGVHTGKLKLKVLFSATLMTAVAVGSMGILGFVGLIAPHISRRILGIDLRYSFVGSILIGSLLLLAADLIAQRSPLQTELPVGVVTALFGAPVILILLRKRDLNQTF